MAQDLLLSRLGDAQRGIAVTPKLAKVTIAEALKAVVDDLKMNGRKSAGDAERRIRLHLLTSFHPDRRMNTLTTSDLTAHTAKRLEAGASAASCNHDMAIIKRAFRLALRAGELVAMPYVPMLKLNNVRTGFLEREQFERVREALAPDLRGVVTFAYLTAWRVRSEVLTFTWGQVDRERKVIRLEPGATKNKEGRTLPYELLPDLLAVIDAQWEEHERLKGEGTICPYVFQRDGAPIRDFRHAWNTATEKAGAQARSSMTSDEQRFETLSALASRRRSPWASAVTRRAACSTGTTSRARTICAPQWGSLPRQGTRRQGVRPRANSGDSTPTRRDVCGELPAAIIAYTVCATLCQTSFQRACTWQDTTYLRLLGSPLCWEPVSVARPRLKYAPSASGRCIEQPGTSMRLWVAVSLT